MLTHLVKHHTVSTHLLQAVFFTQARHLGVLLGYLEQVLRKLLENKIASARQTIRLAAKVHWDRKRLGAWLAAMRWQGR